jgi:adenosylcobinamide kinase/adenosylcobinamide-phosphate guanylyltransferase
MKAPGVTLILGGARSGKSQHALGLADEHLGDAVFIATATANDAEMAARIANHQAERGTRWQTVEAPVDLPDALRQLSPNTAVCLVDCLTLWLTNLMMAERDVAADAQRLIDVLEVQRVPTILVTNEVGFGIVPENALARRFRDEAGRLHQQVAKIADRVILMAAGLPLILKGG